MDQETVQRLNRMSLENAKKALSQSEPKQMDMNALLVVLVVAVGTYFLLKEMKPKFVMRKNQQGQEVVCEMRLVLVSALVALLAYYLYNTM